MDCREQIIAKLRQNRSHFFGSSKNISTIYSLYQSSLLPNIKVCSEDILFKPSIKLLGLTISNDISWNYHIANISRRVHSTLYHLRMHTYNLPNQTKLSLAKSLILPIFDYNCLVFNDFSGFIEQKLKKLLNSCLRYIYNIPRFAHVTPYRKQANLLSPQFRHNFFSF